MISAANAYTATTAKIDENMKLLFEKELHIVQCAISKAINDGHYHTTVTTIESYPEKIVEVLEKEGYEATLDTAGVPTILSISWENPKNVQKAETATKKVKFLPMNLKDGPWVDWCSCAPAAVCVARDFHATCQKCHGRDGYHQSPLRQFFEKCPSNYTGYSTSADFMRLTSEYMRLNLDM